MSIETETTATTRWVISGSPDHDPIAVTVEQMSGRDDRIRVHSGRSTIEIPIPNLEDFIRTLVVAGGIVQSNCPQIVRMNIGTATYWLNDQDPGRGIEMLMSQDERESLSYYTEA